MTIISTLLALAILFAFMLFEGRLRQGKEAASFEAGEHDRQSTRLLGLAYMLCILILLLSFVLNAFGITSLPGWLGWSGVVLAALGIQLRSWSNRVLGMFYTRTLKVTEGQTIVRAGPYGLVRHPGYLGMILAWIGVALATANAMVILIVAVLIVSVYVYRIENEEKMLLGSLEGYAEYRAHTWRLLPLVY